MTTETLTTEQTLAATRTFQQVPIEILEELVALASRRILPGGGALFRPGEPYKKEIYVLLEGNVVMHRPSGRQDSVQPGDLIGLANYLDKNDYTTKTVATSRSIILAIPEAHFKRLEESRPELFNALSRIIATKLRERSPDRSISTGVLAQPATSIMRTPVISCHSDIQLSDAFGMMDARKIGGLVITDRQGVLEGVITYAGLANAMIVQRADPDDRISQITLEPPRVIDTDTALWEAEEIMKRHNAKYLIVQDNQLPIGMLSQTDILRVLISRPSTLTNRFREAESIQALSA